MQRRLEEFGGEGGEHIVFAHANGYPPGSYRRFIEYLTPHFRLTGFHQRPLWSPEMPPQRLNWRRFSRDVIETLEATQCGPVWMMGHSMGSTVATLAAATRPDLFKGLILIDPVFFSTRGVAAINLARPGRMKKAPMVRKTLARPNRFASHEDAFRFHREKHAFSRFSDEVLWDYIYAGTRPAQDGSLQLAYAREWEAAAYMSAPWIWRDIARIRLPVLGLRGETSDTLTPRAFRRWGRLQRQAVLRECPGGHLLPMEEPQSTAQAIIDYLQARQ
jgi:pimeloyl-ACP methyl ester carboxylesterase